ETYTSFAPRGLPSFLEAMPQWLKQKLWIPDVLSRELEYDGPLLFPEHHHSHAASAFYPSPFERAAFLTTDGVGEWATTSFGAGREGGLSILGEIHFPHSLGLLYSAFTYFCGFRVNSGEYKLMGLAPYGRPRYVETIRDRLIDLRDDGSFRLDMEYFTYPAGLTMTGRRFADLFGGPPRAPEGPLTEREMDLARSIQEVTEDAMLRMARHVHRETGERNLCLAGGVALNCVANGRLLREGPFERLWIQPAAGDAGGAVGAALVAWHEWAGEPRRPAPDDAMSGSFLGPAFEDATVDAFLEREGIPHERVGYADLPDRVAGLLADGKVVGWFQGRMEFGPRALGARSILADPRGRDVQRAVNLKIKFRESFRPFAPSVRAERSKEYFDLDVESPYMLLVARVDGASIEGEGLERLRHVESRVPAVTHVDGSARVQTVHEQTNPLFYRLLLAFEAMTGCAVLVNTSFNVRGEPIVCTPEDAYRCFRRTHIDALAIGPFLVLKDELPDSDREVYTAEQVAQVYGLD
ncbi:MAG TPA: carbamoyltransferase N-terminal domain-containing protein, partial [Gemmatimonadota bacterium]|nr:carbamoyltransferase N-terminal domain-containing protein [Gemmatimonadota bacterium]